LFLSPKYESKSVIFDSSHIVVVSNEIPLLSNLSPDRWEIYLIVNESKILYTMDKMQMSDFYKELIL